MLSKIDDRQRFTISKNLLKENKYILDFNLENSTVLLSPFSTAPHHH
jgi:hypothetical protein